MRRTRPGRMPTLINGIQAAILQIRGTLGIVYRLAQLYHLTKL